MFRNLENYVQKNYDATKTAKVDMVVGMGVVKVGNEVNFPEAETAQDIFIVYKELVPTGLDSLRGEISEYELQNIKAGEYVKLNKPASGEQFWTDQYVDGVAVGDYVVVGTDGKFVKAATGTSNLKVFSTTIKDAGKHTGIAIEVVDWKTI